MSDIVQLSILHVCEYIKCGMPNTCSLCSIFKELFLPGISYIRRLSTGDNSGTNRRQKALLSLTNLKVISAKQTTRHKTMLQYSTRIHHFRNVIFLTSADFLSGDTRIDLQHSQVVVNRVIVELLFVFVEAVFVAPRSGELGIAK